MLVVFLFLLWHVKSQCSATFPNKLPGNCENVLSGESCTPACDSGFYLVGATNLTCLDTSFLDIEPTCAGCLTNCSVCTNSTVCITCATGYYLSANRCLVQTPCSPNPCAAGTACRIDSSFSLGYTCDITILGMFANTAALNERKGYARLALQHLNNKTDGIFDDLLPNATLNIIFTDPACVDADAINATLYGLFGFTPQVHGFIGPPCSGTAISTANLIGIYQLPQISFSATSYKLSDKSLYPYFSRTCPSDVFESAALAELAVTQGWKRIAVVTEPTEFATAMSTNFLNKYLSLDSRNQILNNIILPTLADSSAIIQRLSDIRDSGARIIYLFIGTTELAAYWFNNISSSGILAGPEFTWLGMDWANAFPTSTIATAGAKANAIGLLSFAPYIVPNSVLDRNLAQYLALAGNPLFPNQNSNRSIYNQFSPHTYDAVITFGIAYTRAMSKKLSVSVGRNVNAEVVNISFAGMTGNISFNANQDREGGYRLNNMVSTSSTQMVATWSRTLGFSWLANITWKGGVKPTDGSCPNDCSGYGICTYGVGQCRCDTGLTGPDCSQPTGQILGVGSTLGSISCRSYAVYRIDLTQANLPAELNIRLPYVSTRQVGFYVVTPGQTVVLLNKPTNITTAGFLSPSDDGSALKVKLSGTVGSTYVIVYQIPGTPCPSSFSLNYDFITFNDNLPSVETTGSVSCGSFKAYALRLLDTDLPSSVDIRFQSSIGASSSLYYIPPGQPLVLTTNFSLYSYLLEPEMDQIDASISHIYIQNPQNGTGYVVVYQVGSNCPSSFRISYELYRFDQDLPVTDYPISISCRGYKVYRLSINSNTRTALNIRFSVPIGTQQAAFYYIPPSADVVLGNEGRDFANMTNITMPTQLTSTDYSLVFDISPIGVSHVVVYQIPGAPCPSTFKISYELIDFGVVPRSKTPFNLPCHSFKAFNFPIDSTDLPGTASIQFTTSPGQPQAFLYLVDPNQPVHLVSNASLLRSSVMLPTRSLSDDSAYAVNLGTPTIGTYTVVVYQVPDTPCPSTFYLHFDIVKFDVDAPASATAATVGCESFAVYKVVLTQANLPGTLTIRLETTVGTASTGFYFIPAGVNQTVELVNSNFVDAQSMLIFPERDRVNDNVFILQTSDPNLLKEGIAYIIVYHIPTASCPSSFKLSYVYEKTVVADQTIRKTIGYLVLVATVGVCLGTALLIAFRRSAFPYNQKSLILLISVTISTLTFINIPLIGIIQGDYSCGALYFLYLIGPPLFVVSILVSLYRHRIFHIARKIKRRIASRQGVDAEVNQRILELARRTSEKHTGFMLAVCMIPFLVVAIVLTATGPSGTFQDGCPLHPRVTIPYIVYGVFGLGGLIYGLVMIRNIPEIIGLRRDVLFLTIYGSIFGIISIILKLSIGTTAQSENDVSYLWWAIVFIYQTYTLLIAGLMNLPWVLATRNTSTSNLPLEDVLNARDGFQFFLIYCILEYSEENPICWRSITQFKTKTTYATFIDIWDKYLSPDAPFPVNVPGAVRDDVAAFVKSTTPETALEKLQPAYDQVEVELRALMVDSFDRFCQHDLFQRFKKGESPPTSADAIRGTSITSSGESGLAHSREKSLLVTKLAGKTDEKDGGSNSKVELGQISSPPHHRHDISSGGSIAAARDDASYVL